MIKYDSKTMDPNNELNEVIGDYLYLSSLNSSMVGAFLYPYDSVTNNFDLLVFYKNLQNEYSNSSIVYVQNNRFKVVNFNESFINLFVSDIKKENILYEKDGILTSKVKENIKYPSNMLELDIEYINSIKNNIKTRQEDKLTSYLKVFYTLVDYYKILIKNENYEMLKYFFSNIMNGTNEQLKEIHNDALIQALSKTGEEDSRFLSDENVKILRRIIDK